MEPMETPPIRAADELPVMPMASGPKCPATAMPTIPTSGIVMFARMLGTASLRIALFI